MARYWSNERQKHDGRQQEESRLISTLGTDITTASIFLQLLLISDMVDQ